jgi:hypothetical protein
VIPKTPVPARYPVLHRADGDFTTGEILAATGGSGMPPAGPLPVPGLAQAALRARLWRLDGTQEPQALAGFAASAGIPGPRGFGKEPGEAETALLRAFETASLWTVPVAGSTAGLDPATARAWLALAAHWACLARTARDLRFLSIACKLLGAVWARHRPPAPGTEAGHRDLIIAAAAVAQVIEDASADIRRRLAGRLILHAGQDQPHPYRQRSMPNGASTRPPAIVVLASSGSGTARRIAAEAVTAGVPVSLVCWYSPGQAGPPPETSYAQAWYPPEDSPPARSWPLPPDVPQAAARSWDDAAAILRTQDADLVILAGMPVVPAPVLATARLGVINAHNGALPGYRGMDAVGWALLNNDPVVCTAHVARPAVDAGEIIAALPVPASPAGTLKSRVKDAQVALLIAAAAFTAAHGRLPDASPQQPGPGRQYYRMHPHVKRLLDASPYARSGNAAEGAYPS